MTYLIGLLISDIFRPLNFRQNPFDVVHLVMGDANVSSESQDPAEQLASLTLLARPGVRRVTPLPATYRPCQQSCSLRTMILQQTPHVISLNAGA